MRKSPKAMDLNAVIFGVLVITAISVAVSILLHHPFNLSIIEVVGVYQGVGALRGGGPSLTNKHTKTKRRRRRSARRTG